MENSERETGFPCGEMNTTRNETERLLCEPKGSGSERNET